MKFILVTTFLFVIGCFSGWIIELFFRRFVHKTWVNPGFLKGPYLPLYGFGLVSLYLVAIIPLENVIANDYLCLFIKVIIFTCAATFIEYIAGLIFIKGMHIKLWDYSSMWGNIQGIICPLFTLFWALIGIVYLFGIHNYIIDAVVWFTNNIYYSFFVGIFLGLMIFDFGTSLKLATNIKKFAKEKHLDVRWEELKVSLKNVNHKTSFFNPFNGAVEKIKEESGDLKKSFTPSFSKTTLVYLIQGEKVLMMYRNKKENDPNKNKYVGVGGHIEFLESKSHAAKREVLEETGLTVNSLNYQGKVLFSLDGYKEIMYLYTSSDFTGELKSCDEGTLSWVDKKDISNLDLWEGDQLFLTPLFNNEKNIKLKLIYKNNELIESKRYH